MLPTSPTAGMRARCLSCSLWLCEALVNNSMWVQHLLQSFLLLIHFVFLSSFFPLSTSASNLLDSAIISGLRTAHELWTQLLLVMQCHNAICLSATRSTKLYGRRVAMTETPFYSLHVNVALKGCWSCYFKAKMLHGVALIPLHQKYS